MTNRYEILAAVFVGMLLRGVASGAEPKDVRLDRFADELRRVVERHFPQAELTRSGSEIHFEFKTRRFLIHEPTLKGEWQDAHEETGPQPGGICGDIELRTGPYQGMAVVPQTFDKRYFVLSLSAPYSKKLDQHLYIHLKHPRGVSKEFMAEFQQLVGKFERYVTSDLK